MTITVVGGTSKADQQEAWYQARKKFGDIKLELPDGVIGPIFNDEYGDVTGLLYAVKGDGISQWELSDIAEDVKRRLLKVPMVKKIDIYGKQAKKVYVEFSHQRLAALGITPIMIAESLGPERRQPPSVDTARRPRARAGQGAVQNLTTSATCRSPPAAGSSARRLTTISAATRSAEYTCVTTASRCR